MSTTHDVSANQLREAARLRSHELCGLWLSSGSPVKGKNGLEWRVGDIHNNPSRHGAGHGSYRVGLEGRHEGFGIDFAMKGERRDDWLDIIAANIVPDDPRDTPLVAAIKWLKTWLMMGSPNGRVPRVIRDPAERVRDDERRQKGIQIARRMWDESTDLKGSVAERYLRARGITMPIAADVLRAMSRCGYYEQVNGKPTRIAEYPALIAPVRALNGDLVGLHRTYLTPDGSGKAAVECPKKMIGDIAGGSVRLCDEEDVRVTLGITEGIETGLSVMQKYEVPVWAGMSTSGVTGMRVPHFVREVMLFADNDPAQLDAAGRPVRDHNGNTIHAGKAAALLAGERFREEGRTTQIFMPRNAKDYNEGIMREAGLI